LTVEEVIKIAPLVSAAIAAIAALVAACSATFAGVQMLLARRTSVLQVLQSFDKAVGDREAALGSAKTEETKEHAFHEFMNLLELYAAICNRNLVTGLAYELIRDRLIDSVVVIERAKTWHDIIDQAIFHSGTFEELRLLLETHKSILAARRGAAEKRHKMIAQASPA
jgi:hypothetical protein